MPWRRATSSGAPDRMVREFVRDPQRLARLDASCAGRFPEIRAIGVFPVRLADQPLPVAAAGNEASTWSSGWRRWRWRRLATR